MNRTQLVNYLFNKNPKWKVDGVNLTSVGLQKLIETSFDQGVRHANSLNNSKPQSAKTPYENIFKDIFPWT